MSYILALLIVHIFNLCDSLGSVYVFLYAFRDSLGSVYVDLYAFH